MTTLRGVRLLRVLRLVRALPRLQVLILGLLASLSSIGYVLLLLLLLFYLYAVLGVSLFATNDPLHWGSLHVGLLTLFRVAVCDVAGTAAAGNAAFLSLRCTLCMLMYLASHRLWKTGQT